MAYTRYGPFVNDGPPALDAAFYNGQEDQLVNIANVADAAAAAASAASAGRPGAVNLDTFASGQSDDAKLTAAFSYIGAATRAPGLQLPNRDLTFTLRRDNPPAGLRIYGASGYGSLNLQIANGKDVPYKVTLNIPSPGGGAPGVWLNYINSINGLTIEEVAFQSSNTVTQLAASLASPGVYPMDLRNCTFYGLKHVLGTPTAKFLTTQLSVEGHFQVQAPFGTQFTLGGSEIGWAAWFNMQGNSGTAGGGTYMFILDSVQKSYFGGPKFYITCVNGWRGLKLLGNSADTYDNIFVGARIEGASTTNSNAGSNVLMNGGGYGFYGCGFAYAMTAPLGTEHAMFEQTGGDLSLIDCTLDPSPGVSYPTVGFLPSFYQSGGRSYVRRAKNNRNPGGLVPATVTAGVMDTDRTIAATGAGSIWRNGTLLNSGAPTTNVTGLGQAGVGDPLVDTTNGKLYVCTATNESSTISWALVGTQS